MQLHELIKPSHMSQNAMTYSNNLGYSKIYISSNKRKKNLSKIITAYERKY